MQSTKNGHPGESANQDGGRQPSSPEKYNEERKDYSYYKVAKSLLLSICREEDSILDVGPRGVDMVSFLPCREKKTIDLKYPYADENTQGIKGDYLAYDAKGTDIITCFQVLEHLQDEDAVAMARKLLDEARIAIVSVPYMWEKGRCKWHVQDPVDVDKLVSWFGTTPVHIQKTTEKDHLSRIVAVFEKGKIADLDFEYWRKDAADTAKALEKYRENPATRRP